MENKTSKTYNEIVGDLAKKKFSSLYFLQGEETYLIDKLSNEIIDSVLDEEQKDFNLITFYGSNTTIDNIINTAKGFPLNAEYLVILVKDAQELTNIEKIKYYFAQSQKTTILLFCYNNKSLDKRKKITQEIENKGIIFNAERLTDKQLYAFVVNYLKRNKKKISMPLAASIIEYIGNDLNRIVSSLNKLIASSQESIISEEIVSKSIGWNKEYNIYELQEAIGKKDFEKAFHIFKYFDSNSKDYPIQKILTNLFFFFRNIMLAHYSPNKTERGIAHLLGLQNWQVRKNILPYLPNYSAVKVMNILNCIRRLDADSKGKNGITISTRELMDSLMMQLIRE